MVYSYTVCEILDLTRLYDVSICHIPILLLKEFLFKKEKFLILLFILPVTIPLPRNLKYSYRIY